METFDQEDPAQTVRFGFRKLNPFFETQKWGLGGASGGLEDRWRTPRRS
jgi:hypothetical protein